jgi:hypothetical protein
MSQSELHIQTFGSKCGSEWRIAWVKAGFPRVRGPVWETSERLADEAMAKKMAEKEGK